MVPNLEKTLFKTFSSFGNLSGLTLGTLSTTMMASVLRSNWGLSFKTSASSSTEQPLNNNNALGTPVQA